MKTFLAAFMLLALPSIAWAQTVPAGQTAGGINANVFANNTDAVGFSEQSLSPAVVAAGTTQATATLLTTRTNIITTCAASAGVVLPGVQRFVQIVVINRSGNTCIVYPTPGATVETSSGTAGAVNAGATVASNSRIVFSPVSATAWLQ